MGRYQEIALVTLFGSLIVGCGNTPTSTGVDSSGFGKSSPATDGSKKAIIEVLEKTKAIAALTESESQGMRQKYWNTNEAKSKFVQRLRSIDLKDCPEDFRSVYIDWQRALTNYVNSMSKYDGWTGVGNATLAMFNGEYSVAEPSNVANAKLAEIGKQYDRMIKSLSHKPI
jgi:hypothetical protein